MWLYAAHNKRSDQRNWSVLDQVGRPILRSRSEAAVRALVDASNRSGTLKERPMELLMYRLALGASCAIVIGVTLFSMF